MPIIVPGGTVIVPKEESAVVPVAGSSWTERYVVDWSAEAAHDWKANAAAFDVQGAAWAANNMAAASQCEIVPGSGLEISPDAAVSAEWFSTQGTGTLYARVTDWTGPGTGLYPGVGNLQAVCLQALISGPLTQDNNGYGMTITGSPGGFALSIERLHSSAVWAGGSNSGYRISNSYNGGLSWSALSSAEDGAVYELFELILFPGSLALASIRNEASFVEPFGSSVYRKQVSVNAYNGNNEALNTWIPSNVWVQLLSYNGALNTHTATFKKLRVLSLGVV